MVCFKAKNQKKEICCICQDACKPAIKCRFCVQGIICSECAISSCEHGINNKCPCCRRQKENGEKTERKKGEPEEETEEETKETKQASSKLEGRKANGDKDESDNRNSAPMTPINSVTSQNGLIEDDTENEHAESNAGKDNFEQI